MKSFALCVIPFCPRHITFFSDPVFSEVLKKPHCLVSLWNYGRNMNLKCHVESIYTGFKMQFGLAFVILLVNVICSVIFMLLRAYLM